MGYQVALLNFEGPLDLLLQLVERSEMAATELSLRDVTEQYLAHIEALDSLDPGEASRFTNLAAKLLYIKSLHLLPGPVSEEAAEETAELQRQLSEYRTYQEAAQRLSNLLTAPPRAWSRSQASTPMEAAPPTNLGANQLRAAYIQALARAKPQQHQVGQPQLSLKTAIAELRTRISQGEVTHLDDLFSQAKTQAEVVVTFLAALELWRQGTIQLTQAAQFSIIEVDYAATHSPA